MSGKMPFPCIMFSSIRKFDILKETYDVGWLVLNEELPYILRWGNTKNKDTSLKLCDDLLNKQGERLILRYDSKIEPMEDYTTSGMLAISHKTAIDILSNAEILHNYFLHE